MPEPNRAIPRRVGVLSKLSQPALGGSAVGLRHRQAKRTSSRPPARQRFAAELGESTSDFEVDPPNPTPDGDRNGSWIVGQAHTRPELGRGDWIIHLSSGATVVVKPTLAAGGVDPD